MLILITGGAGSGKSLLAEEICQRLPPPRLYIATMQAADEESRRRVERHRAQRAGKGFDTLERYWDLEWAAVETGYGSGLLECLGNLVANELFYRNVPAAEVQEKICGGIEALQRQIPNLAVVSNDLFAGHQQYRDAMESYLQCLARLGRLLAQRADVVIESVCGLPWMHKGEINY